MNATTAHTGSPAAVPDNRGQVKALFVAVEGPTGAGKTTLAARLAPVLAAVVTLDPFDAVPSLPELLASDAPDGALAVQVELTMLAHRLAQLRRIACHLP
jgi:deoxyadenosine/deoxycytidine kinase